MRTRRTSHMQIPLCSVNASASRFYYCGVTLVGGGCGVCSHHSHKRTHRFGLRGNKRFFWVKYVRSWYGNTESGSQTLCSTEEELTRGFISCQIKKRMNFPDSGRALSKQLQQSWGHSPTGFRCCLVTASAFGLEKASVLVRQRWAVDSFQRD